MNVWNGIPVLKDPMVPLTKTMPDGTTKPLLCLTIKHPVDLHLWVSPLMLGFDQPTPAIPTPPRTVTKIHVHPDRWDAFWLAVNQPDIFAHPDVRELLVPTNAGARR